MILLGLFVYLINFLFYVITELLEISFINQTQHII